MPDSGQSFRKVTFLGAELDRGAPVSGSSRAPSVIRGLFPVDDLRRRGVDAAWVTAGMPPGDGDSYPDRLVDVREVCEILADDVETAIRTGRRFVAIGGDHSCAIGTWSGAARALADRNGADRNGADRGRLGLVWVDAHMDSHTPQTSPSQAIHGMPLAVLLGHGEACLTELAGRTPALAPANVTQLGVRSFEPEEAALLARLGVHTVAARDARRTEVWDAAFARATNRTAGFGVTIDLDAFDPLFAAGVNTPIADGLAPDRTVEFIRRVAADPRFLGVEIVELNPRRDRDGTTAKLAAELIGAALEL